MKLLNLREAVSKCNCFRVIVFGALTFLFCLPALRAQSSERVDLDAVYKIKEQGFHHSQLMEVVEHLTDVCGARLTGSPNAKAAGDYTAKVLEDWGLSNVHIESWGPFGRSWVNHRFYAQALSPQEYPLIAYPEPWTPGTNGPVAAPAVMVSIETEEDMARYHGQLRGKYAMMSAVAGVPAHFDPLAHRYTDAELEDLTIQPESKPHAPAQVRRGPRRTRAFMEKYTQFLVDEGVACTIYRSNQGDEGTVYGTAGASQDASSPPSACSVTMANEQYDRVARMLARNIPVSLEFNIQNEMSNGNLDSFNVIAEIPGTDKKDEVVMLGGHLDSWTLGTGATDNAAGAAVAMEAMRILHASGLKLRRTVRLALWTGEEQIALGSQAYVKAHFADSQTMQVKPEHARLSAYFNQDRGTGKIRGIYLQGNETVAPIFEAWMRPLRNMGMTTLAISDFGGSDHLMFDAVGLPAFQFLQDPIEYETRTHHSNMDVYERIQPEDLMGNAVIMAAFVYHAANRDELLPRKPMPKPKAQAGAH